jgi:hypothetical protein
MLEYRIPIARAISAVVVGVCFFVALIVMNLQAAGKARTFGLLGVTMVLASAFLHAANVSVASVYGTNTVVYAAGWIVAAVSAAVGLVLLALAVIRARETRTARGEY